MIKASCHCGAVKFELRKQIDTVTRCNCSICRKLNVLWAYGDTTNTKIEMEEGATTAYIWGDKQLAFHFCKTCGCTTHYEVLDQKEPKELVVNCLLAEPSNLKNIRIRHFDGADTWKFLD